MSDRSPSPVTLKDLDHVRAVAIERERTRQVARTGNLNQITCRANTQAETADAVEVIAYLVAIEWEVARLVCFRDERPDAR